MRTDPRPRGAAQPSAHENRILARLAGIEGVPRVTGEQEPAAAQSLPLAQALAHGPLPVPALLDLASHLAQTLAAMHRRGVLHQNINPRHILLNGFERPPLLTGFHLATTFAEERPGFTHHNEIRGNLTYLAPEQTGRTGRSVDLRADLYSLGATLYESATGRPPFDAVDPLQLLHDHLAQVPPSPMQFRADLPAALSDIILRLLEKEPERRYQSAEGLSHDLTRVKQALARHDITPMRLGEHDYPMQLSAPARLVGRSAEIGQLSQALAQAVQGYGRIVLVTGAPGVGKTSLINELRPLVTARRGWFISGKFDQYRHEAPTAPTQAFRALGRFLLAEPEAPLASQRERILRALGANAGVMCDSPEFALLLGSQPEVPAAEPAATEARLLATAVNLLRAIVSPERPLVMVLDDLQWADALSIRLIEAVMETRDLPGLLLVGSYRDNEVDATHALTTMLSRATQHAQPPLRLALANLPPDNLGELLQEMMRLPEARAKQLAQVVGEHTGGNPYDSMELLNGLRRDGALLPAAGGWEWDATALRRYVGHGGVLGLLAARIARLPLPSQAVLHALACLGGQVPLGLLAAALGLSDSELDEQMAAPLEDGLLTIESGGRRAVRMRHDRVQQAVYGSLEPGPLRTLHLGLARRLAESPRYRTAAVQQYLACVEAIDEPEERRKVALLLRATAIRSRSAAHHAVAERMSAAALSLMSGLQPSTAADDAVRASMEVDHHTSLCSLGRFEEADALYRRIEERGAPVEEWVDAACAQVSSLHNRSLLADAVMLGLPLLRQLGLEVPHDFKAVDLEQRMAGMAEWLTQVDLGRDSRTYDGDARATAKARLISRLGYPAYFFDVRITSWLLLEGHVLWIRHGPSPELVHCLASPGGVTFGVVRDYRIGYDGARHTLGISESRGWEPSTSQARFLLGLLSSHWFEPLEHGVRHLHQAREGLMRNGDLHAACFSYVTTTLMLDCAPTLAEWESEFESGRALASRLHNDYLISMSSIEMQLLRELRCEAAATEMGDAQTALLRLGSARPLSLSIHVCRALRAAVFGDMPGLVLHAAAAMKHVHFVKSAAIARQRTYRGFQASVLQVLALAHQVKTATPAARAALLAELDTIVEWLAERAADAPDNFMHVVKWLNAERAWSVADFTTAAAAFDAALCEVESVTRPWHHAMIAERCGLFHLERGMSKSGRQFIAQARTLYKAWGADAKVRLLDSTHGFLGSASSQASRHFDSDRGAMAVDTIDTLAILRASQALSSETSLARLQLRVADVMGALTGATAVRFALWDEDRKDWFLSDGKGADAKNIPVADAGSLLPLSAFRYAERTREPLLVEDATRDDRFARDTYFAAVARCSLLIVPILNQGSMCALLLLENRLSRGAFTTARLDAVSLIAGQLAVATENAVLYDRLEQRVRDQTLELVGTARRAGMAQIATNVLHNVGNVLTSVNVSAHVLAAKVRQSRAARLGDLADLLEAHATDLGRFFESDERGRMLPRYVRELAESMVAERNDMLGELNRLGASVDHIKNVVAMQQSYAGAAGALECCSITALVDDALGMQHDALVRHRVKIAKDCAHVAPGPTDKTRLMQIMVNLIENARQAMDSVPGERTLGIALRTVGEWAVLTVSDNGCGIAADNLPRIFSHGFTTKPDGHGFGLHSSAVAAMEMGGVLSVHSDGPGTGATFTLRLPLTPGAQQLNASEAFMDPAAGRSFSN